MTASLFLELADGSLINADRIERIVPVPAKTCAEADDAPAEILWTEHGEARRAASANSMEYIRYLLESRGTTLVPLSKPMVAVSWNEPDESAWLTTVVAMRSACNNTVLEPVLLREGRHGAVVGYDGTVSAEVSEEAGTIWPSLAAFLKDTNLTFDKDDAARIKAMLGGGGHA